ncbi:MAG TPA: hypothetical protein VHF23_09205 [Gaiellaceae bacterium]|nr:hypothetical protein [Gaiellaceae bacterium]
MPDPRSLYRFVALAAFILTVALALWLLEAEPVVIWPVMIAAWAVAAALEWAAWRLERPRAAASPEEAVDEEVAAAAGAAAPPPPAGPAALVVPHAGPDAYAEHAAAGAAAPPDEGEEAPAPATPPERERPPLRAVPSPAPAPEAPAGPLTPPAAAERQPRPAAAAGVVDLRTRATLQPRRWNLWDLERLARDELHGDPLRFEELSYLFVHLRRFASPDGSLPTEFDGLVRESFGDLLEQRR